MGKRFVHLHQYILSAQGKDSVSSPDCSHGVMLGLHL